MLRKMGWTEGKGLGKTEEGISECVQQRRREEGQGLGVGDKKSFKWNDNWWDDVYNSAMTKFKYVKKEKKEVSSTSSSSEESSDSSSESDNSIAKFHKTKKIQKVRKVVIVKKQREEKKE